MINFPPLQNPDEIYPIPDMPSEIKDAASNGKLVVFIGAGASRIIGCCGWKELAAHLVDASFKNKRINHWEQEKLKTNDPRKIISILKNVIEQADYEKVLEESLEAKPDLLEKFPIYSHLIKLRSIYITTNIDTHFDSLFEQPRIYIEPSQFKPENLTSNTLFKLHGSRTVHRTVIFTTQDYISHYNRQVVKTFLEFVFGGEYTVLFVGYSMAELEILDYVLLKGNADKSQTTTFKEPKRFLLLPFFGSEKGLLRFDRAYFNTLNVVTVPYAIDAKGHDQLYFVIKAWEKEINISTAYLFQSYKFLEDNTENYIDSNASDVLQLVKNDDHFRDHFFKRLMTIKWFSPLREKGFFSAEHNPYPVPSLQEGYYSIPEWNVLPYLERVSEQVSTPENEKFIDDLLAIIKDVSNYRDPKGQHIDNYRTWWYFSKILVNLPTEKATEEIINLIPIWLDSKFSTMLPGSEIAGKLLPKLLNSGKPEDWKKAERLIEIVTDVKWVSLPEAQKNIYEREIEVKTIIEPHWLRKGFEKNFERIGRVCSVQVIEAIAKRILAIFSRKNGHSYDVDYEDKKYQITHALLEDGKHQISVQALRISEELDGYGRNKVEKELVRSFDIPDFESKAAFVAKVKEALVGNIFASLNSELEKAIAAIYSLHDYTYIEYNSLSASPSDIHFDDEKILIYILKEIVAAKAQHDTEETGKILDKFLSRNYPYPFFKRLVLFIAGKEWDRYKEYFFKAVKLEDIRCFEESDYAKELSALFKNNFSKFTNDEKEMIKNIIETGPQLLPDENPEKYRAYWKLKWLSLMKDDPLFAPLFEEQKKLTGIEKEEFAFGSEIKVSEGFGRSPLSAEEILNLPPAELVRRLKEFRSEKKWEGMTVAALAGTLKEAVKANPKMLTDNLNLFESVGFAYVYKILDGLKDAWNEKTAIDWNKAFNFIVSYTKQDQFWEDKLIVEKDGWLGEANHQWIAGIVSDLLQDGTRDDAWAFPEEHFEKAQAIVFLLLDKLKVEEDKEITDYVTYTLNTALGRTVTALVLLALRKARVEDKKGIASDIRWSSEFREKYEEILGKKSVEGYTNLGRYMPNFYYLDKEWIKEKIKSLEDETGSKYWEAFINGYLSIGKVYDDLYELMRQHYQFSFSYNFKEKRDREYLIHHICIGYLRGHEALDATEGLFRKIIDEWRPEQIREVIGFFWMQRDSLNEKTKENEKMKGKIIEFWKLLYDKYKGKDEGSLSPDDKHILSVVSKLSAILPKIDAESYEWLMASAPYVHEDFNSPFFIEYLDELKDKGDRSETVKYIGNVYLEVLNKFTPDYDQAHIRSIVEFLYIADGTDSASRICNIYGARGHEFLRSIYEKHQSRA